MNRIYPLVLDDYVYSFVRGEARCRITSFSDIFRSQYNHYFSWGGRSVVHVIAEFLLMIGVVWADLLNTIVFVFFILLLYKIANIGVQNKNVVFFLLAAFATWLLQPAFAATLLWITGSANYLWGTFIILLFLYPFFNYYITEQTKDTLPKSILIFFSGIIAGWTNENMAIAMCFIIFSLLIIFKVQKISIPKWAIFGFVGAVVGCGIMLAAPGNYVRYEMEMESRGISMEVAKSLDMYIERLGPIWKLYRKRMLLLVILNFILAFIYIKKSNSLQKKKVTIIWLLLFASAHLATIAMVAAPEFPPRAAFGVITFLILSFGLLFVHLGVDTAISKKIYRNITIFCIVGISVYFTIDYIKKYTVINQINDVLHAREVYINEHKKLGQKDFVFKGKLEVPAKYYFFDFESDPGFIWNQFYSRFMDIRTIVVIPEDGKDSKSELDKK